LKASGHLKSGFKLLYESYRVERTVTAQVRVHGRMLQEDEEEKEKKKRKNVCEPLKR